MRTYKYIALAAMGLLFAACEKDDITPSAQNDTDAVRINATIGSMMTRTVTDGENVSFVDGDKILVKNLSRTVDNQTVYTKNATGWEAESTLLWTNGSNSFKAVYPANADFDFFNIPAEQTDLSSADWMIATATATKPANHVLDLTFQHQLALVTVEIAQVGTEYSSANYTLKPAYFYPNEMTAENSHVGFISGHVVSSMTYPNSPVADKKSVWRAVMRPGKYLADSKFMQINLAHETSPGVYSYPTLDVKANSLLVNEGLKPGYDYKFKVNIGKDYVEVLDVVVTPWVEVPATEGIAIGDVVADNAHAVGFEDGQIMTVAAVVGGTNTSVQYAYNAAAEEWQTTAPLLVNDLTEITSINAWVGYPSVSSSACATAISSNDFLTDVANKVCDQSTGLKPFDWMVAKDAIALPTKSNSKFDVEFIHAMSKVTITGMGYRAEYDPLPVFADLAFISRPCLTYDNATGKFTTGSQNGIDYVKVIPYDNGMYSYSALLVPNSSEGVTETTLMTLKINGVDQKVMMNSALEPGKHYTFYLLLSHKSAELVPVDVNLGWNDEVEL